MALDSGFFENVSSSLGKVSKITGQVSAAIQGKDPASAQQARDVAQAVKTGVAPSSLLGSTSSKTLLILGGIGVLIVGLLFFGKKRRR